MKNNNNKKKNNLKNILYKLFFVIVTIAIVLLFVFNSNNNKSEDKTISYTDLIKQVSKENVAKIEMITNSTSIKVTLKNKIDENGELITETEDDKSENESSTVQDDLNPIIKLINEKILKNKDKEEVNPELEKKAIVPNIQSFIELIQEKVSEGNNIEVIQKSPSLWTVIPSYILSLLPTIIMVALFIAIFKMQGIGDKGEI